MDQFLNLLLGFPLGTILGILVGTLLGHRLAQRRAKDDRLSSVWNSECLRFKNAFDDIRNDLCNVQGEYGVAGAIELRFPSHEAAYDRFCQHVTGQYGRDLDDAWKEYEKYCREHQEPELRLHGKDDAERMIVLGHINRLLSFAKET